MGGGFIVRFVDVVLLLLFGFISISTIRQTEIVLPTSAEAPVVPPESREVLYVGIRADGTYLVDQDETVLANGDLLFAHLGARLAALEGVPVTVRIRASHDTPVRYLVEAARVCDALGLPKAFEVLLAGAGG